ncbi:hypothetical protein OOK36_01595 [Streptomyces sp. NBC_00365]|uniref:hypothetical protein n=1 Tax=Streptomyces sp. NBC_00365 TaxID=2975726 RepID=UPI002257C699|nr:hypothetical protein [Streptomyces sp. NBC_00365]MCX5087624.1 hypothetical protein [Streptomyces sp. NBC_00365]
MSRPLERRGRRPRRRRTAGRLQEHPVHPHTPRAEAWPLIGYLLLDTAVQYRIDTVGLYLSRSGMLASRLMEVYLELLGACRRDIAVFRGAFTELLESRTVDDEPYEQEEEDPVQRLLRPSASGVLLSPVPWPRPDSVQQGPAAQWSGPAGLPPSKQRPARCGVRLAGAREADGVPQYFPPGATRSGT